MKLSNALIALLVVDFVVGVLITPAGGMDPRPPSGASALTWVCVGLFMVGLITSLAATVQLLRRRPIGATLALIAPFFFGGVLAADLTNHFHAEVAPAAIHTLELVEAGLALVTLAVAAKVRSARAATPAVTG